MIQVVRVGADVEEFLEVDRQAGVEGVTLHVDEPGARKDRVDQAGVEEVGRHLVGDTCRLTSTLMDPLQVLLSQARLRRQVERAIPECNFSGARYGGVGGQYLLGQRSTGAGHADDKHRYLRL